MAIHYRDLVVWRKAMDLAVEVYALTRDFPECERFGLTDQLRRAAVSIPSNIAEGQGRRLPRQFALFLRTARGSIQELETQTMIAQRLGYLLKRARQPWIMLAKSAAFYPAFFVR